MYPEVKDLRVEYKGIPNFGLDRKLINYLGSQGFEWLGSGYEIASQTRDLCFDNTGYEGVKDESPTASVAIGN